jgi:hypothetical protein
LLEKANGEKGWRLAHAEESYSESTTIEPSESDGDFRVGFEYIGFC